MLKNNRQVAREEIDLIDDNGLMYQLYADKFENFDKCQASRNEIIALTVIPKQRRAFLMQYHDKRNPNLPSRLAMPF
jgi:hypothetical protein